MNKKSLILIGGGGHALSVIDTIEQSQDYAIIGIIDIDEKLGDNLLGYPILKVENKIDKFIAENYHFFISLGQIKNPAIRIDYFNRLNNLGAMIPFIVSPFAYLSKHSSIESGTILLNGSKVNACVHIGANNIINTNANIEHGSTIGNHCHISTNSIVNGDCTIGNEVFLGSNTVLKQGISIADNCIIGAGSVVVKSITEKGLYAGNPCKLIKAYG